MKERITWIDVLKFIGIVEIYFGHYTKPIALARGFVFGHHVHLFFFAAGCAAAIGKDRGFMDNLKNKAVTLLIPFYFFSFASLIVYTLANNANNLRGGGTRIY